VVERDPLVYEFASPIKGSYPIHYDPTHFHTTHRRFDLRVQIRTIAHHAKMYVTWFGPLALGTLVLLAASRDRRRTALGMLAHWPLLLPTLAALAMYSLVLLEGRYVVPFAIILWACLLDGIYRAGDADASRLVGAVALVLGAWLVVPVAFYASGVPDLIRQSRVDPDVHRAAASRLRELGVPAGAKFGVIGRGSWQYWAHLGGYRITAEAPHDVRTPSVDSVWTSTTVYQRVVRAFSDAGVDVIVTEAPAADTVRGWRRVGTAGYPLYVLQLRDGAGE
jgi:hypothetical protein